MTVRQLRSDWARIKRRVAFDLLHVAIANETECRAFLTFDNHQVKLAKAAGLMIKTDSVK